jgi:hypothetical protein
MVDVRAGDDNDRSVAFRSPVSGRPETEPGGGEIVVHCTAEGDARVAFLEYGNHKVEVQTAGYGAVENTITVASANHTVRDAHEVAAGYVDPQDTSATYVGGVLQAR